MAFAPPKLAKKKLDRTVSKVNTKTVDVTKYDLNQIQGIATSAFQAALGRKPTADELNQFLSSLNAFAKAHPTTSTGVDSSHSRTTTNIASQLAGNAATGAAPQALDTGTNTTGGRTSSSTSTGGVDLSNFATQYAQGSLAGVAGSTKLASGFGNYQ